MTQSTTKTSPPTINFPTINMVITSIDLGEIVGTILIANVKTSTKIKGIKFCKNIMKKMVVNDQQQKHWKQQT
jgi:hypothetical protein